MKETLKIHGDGRFFRERVLLTVLTVKYTGGKLQHMNKHGVTHSTIYRANKPEVAYEYRWPI